MKENAQTLKQIFRNGNLNNRSIEIKHSYVVIFAHNSMQESMSTQSPSVLPKSSNELHVSHKVGNNYSLMLFMLCHFRLHHCL